MGIVTGAVVVMGVVAVAVVAVVAVVVVVEFAVVATVVVGVGVGVVFATIGTLELELLKAGNKGAGGSEGIATMLARSLYISEN